MKRAKFYIAQYYAKRRKPKEWLNEVNILIKTLKFNETLKLFDHFRFDNEIYTVTDLCLFDLQYAIDQQAKKG